MWHYMSMKWRLRDFIRRWVKYRAIVTRALDTWEADPALDRQFLRVKAGLVARLHVITDLAPAPQAEDSALRVARITDLLREHASARFRAPGEPWDREEFERVWHEHYIFLSQLKGASPPRRPEPDAKPRPKAESRPEKPAETANARRRQPARRVVAADPIPYGGPKPWARRELHPWGKRFVQGVFKLAFVALLVYIVASAWGVRLGADGRPTMNMPGTFGDAVENILNSLESLWDRVVNIVSPITATYGVLWTFVLLGAVAFAVTYLLLVRN